MFSSVTSPVLDGITARPVRIEVDVHRGLPAFAVVGLPDAAVREIRERVRAAIVNSGFEFPPLRIVVNVAPASLRRVASSLDLPIAVALLRASGQLAWAGDERVAFSGELALDGRVRPLDGALAIAEAAVDAGATMLVTAEESAPEAALARSLPVMPLTDLRGLPGLASGNLPPAPEPLPLPVGPAPEGPDLADLRGGPKVRLALELAAAGGHGVLLVGSPGSGASLAASRLPSILPPLGEAEALEVVRIAGATGRLGPGVPRGRPFRAPHHTISAAGLLGGGIPTRPGEVTLAHRGVLLLDRLGEFGRGVIEALRPALDARQVAVDRAGVRQLLPCGPLLVATSAPCPCGCGGDGCLCGPLDIRRHRMGIAQGLDDHLPLRVDVAPPTAAEIGGAPGQSSAEVRGRVMAARERAAARLGVGRTNAAMTDAEVAGLSLTTAATRLLAADQARGPCRAPDPDRR